ncbi:MAG: cytochrome C biogenesis protein CcsA [Bacteroidales bacterium]|nr:cytochrome C biogenesis protein CcsA [Bacteroidales bacterium]
MRKISSPLRNYKNIFTFLAIAFACSVLFVQCSERTEGTAELTELQEKALSFTSPMPENAFEEGMNKSDEIIELGRMLYYEPRISKSGTISCSSCHSLATFGVDQTPVSIGHGWQKGPVNAPTVLNAAFHKTQFWNGRARDVEEQAGMPILDPLEMAATEEHVLAVLASIPEYVERFQTAFPDQDDPLVYENVGNAIGAFERILLTYSPFDDFLRGNTNALSDQQKKGLETFIEVGCQTCHRGQVMGGEIFTFFQTPKEKETGQFNKGRFDFTQRESDKHFFKVPSLLNIEMTYPYLHDGSVWSLNETVNIVAKEMLSRELTPEQNQLIVEFLKTLTGEIPENAMKLPVLPPSTAETPKPRFDI